MTQEQSIKMKAAFYAAVNEVASVYSRYHATRILSDETSAEYQQWSDAYEQSDKKQKNLWGYIFSSCYKQAQQTLDPVKSALMPE